MMMKTISSTTSNLVYVSG